MLETRKVFDYYLKTGGDLLDDLDKLKSEYAKKYLKRENTYAEQLSILLERLDAIGVDVSTLSLEELTAPTIPPNVKESKLLISEEDKMRQDAQYWGAKHSVRDTLSAFICGELITADVLLDAPYDTAVDAVNYAFKKREEAMNNGK
jgi:hypothetical protein|nr:MAG TPA: hypothetical protein [Caudoviricetes sp.]